MRRRLRLGLIGAAVLAALVFASLAGSTPRLNIAATATTTTVGFSLAATDRAPAKVSILADSTFASVNLTAAPGTTLGTVSAKAAAGALGGAVLPLAGTVKVVAADGTYISNGAPVPIATAASFCTGNASHTTYWVLTLSAAGQTLEVPLFVDAITGPIAKATITLCLPSPDVPPPQGAAFGAKVLEAVLALKGVFPTTPGDYRWRALVTSYTAGTANVDTASTVETQALEHAPGAVTLTAKRSGPGKATVSGKVTEAGKPVANAAVVVAGGRKALRVKTNAGGIYKGVVALPSPRARLNATATVPTRDLGASACTATFTNAGIPCVDAVDSGFTAITPQVRAS
jgi:hypothetical protein